MLKFLEIRDAAGDKRLINIAHLSDIFENFIYLNTCVGDEQIKINTAHSYEELKSMLKNAGVEIY